MKNIKREINFTTFENITEKQLYLIGGGAFIIGHIIYLIMFALLDIPFMMYYQCFSITFYIVLFLFINKVKNLNRCIYIALVEVIVHACLGIYYVGWGLGFALFMLFIVPIPFLMTSHDFWQPYVFSTADILVFTLMKIYMIGRDGVYVFDSEFITNAIYLVNMAFGFAITIYVSSIYMFHREMTTFKLKAKNDSLQKLASIDPLTQLFNRRAMIDFLKMIQASSRSADSSYVIGIGDIDNFKHINDTYGHDYGDEVLKRVSQIMTKCVPTEGYVCRWGGEEFLFTIPNTSKNDGAKIAETIRQKISKEKFQFEENGFSVTITIGICEVHPEQDFEELIKDADRRLYMGKQSGKNKVICNG